MNTDRVKASGCVTAAARRLRVLSLYEGFFVGGARALHSTVVKELHASGSQLHSVLSIYREMRRERLHQAMTSDSRYQALKDAGVRIETLGRSAVAGDLSAFSDAEMAVAARLASAANLVLALKEQPLHLFNHPKFPNRPLVVCLHRSDPQHQGPALRQLQQAIGTNRVGAVVCCAESTKLAYAAAGVPNHLLTVIPNGVDLARFRPVSASLRRKYRRALGVPTQAPLVVFAARYDGMKNVPLLLAAAREFLRRRADGQVVMCGAGMSLRNDDLCADLRVAFGDRPDLLRRVRTLGVRNDMPAIYASADVVALTSSTGEAAPLCLIEGMMCGAIPVATDIGDSRSIVDGHGLITVPEATGISVAWEEAIARRAEWTPALERSRARFSHTRMVAAYATVIEEVAGGRSLPSARLKASSAS